MWNDEKWMPHCSVSIYQASNLTAPCGNNLWTFHCAAKRDEKSLWWHQIAWRSTYIGNLPKIAAKHKLKTTDEPKIKISAKLNTYRSALWGDHRRSLVSIRPVCQQKPSPAVPQTADTIQHFHLQCALHQAGRDKTEEHSGPRLDPMFCATGICISAIRPQRKSQMELAFADSWAILKANSVHFSDIPSIFPVM